MLSSTSRQHGTDGGLARTDALIERISSRLLSEPDERGPTTSLVPAWMPDIPYERPPAEAAVLMSLVRRDAGYTMLYTERSARLRSHSGQIAFPGGKIDPTDRDAGDAALREAAEEVGMRRDDARIIGYLPRYFSGSNYLITPVVAVVEPTAPFTPNPGEVAAVFEVPLDLVMAAGSYGAVRMRRGTQDYTGWELRYQNWLIWGITALLTRRFRDMALAEEAV
jgi:8-oxo-dGTP pyrophosphatase MutT (NUDIX family)